MQGSSDHILLDPMGIPAGLVGDRMDCTCEHALDCGCGCHDHYCDPAARHCDRAFLPDEGGYTRFGCVVCTPGALAPHLDGCAVIGWNVPLTRTA